MEAVPRLLATPVDVADTDPTYGIHRHLDKVPLIQGFKATIPSSEMAKQRRRRVRGGLADEEVGGGKIGLKKLGDQARGLLTEGEEQNEVPDEQGTLVVGRKTKRRRRGHKDSRNHSISGGKELGLEELMRQADEIGMDKDNLRVRRVSGAQVLPEEVPLRLGIESPFRRSRGSSSENRCLGRYQAEAGNQSDAAPRGRTRVGG